MSARRHVDDLFSAAYDDELSPTRRSALPIASSSRASPAPRRTRSSRRPSRPCANCRRRACRTPSTSRRRPRWPRASRADASASAGSTSGLLRRFPATAVAGAVAVVLVVIALARTAGSGTPCQRAQHSPAWAPAGERPRRRRRSRRPRPRARSRPRSSPGRRRPISFAQQTSGCRPRAPGAPPRARAPRTRVAAGATGQPCTRSSRYRHVGCERPGRTSRHLGDARCSPVCRSVSASSEQQLLAIPPVRERPASAFRSRRAATRWPRSQRVPGGVSRLRSSPSPSRPASRRAPRSTCRPRFRRATRLREPGADGDIDAHDPLSALQRAVSVASSR